MYDGLDVWYNKIFMKLSSDYLQKYILYTHRMSSHRMCIASKYSIGVENWQLNLYWICHWRKDIFEIKNINKNKVFEISETTQ